MPVHSLQPFVDRLLLRTHLNEDERAAILTLPAQVVNVRKHRDLVALGQQTDSSYFIVSGIIGRFSQLQNGVRQIVALHIPGDVADLCSVALPKTSWAFHAVVNTSVLKIAHADLIAVASRHHNIAIAFWRDCVVDMSVMSEWIVSIARRSSEARLAHLLCEMRCRYEQAGLLSADGSYPFPVTQQQIADVLGITSIHVNRMVKALKDKGLASVVGNSVLIKDWNGLRTLAEFDTAYLHLNEAYNAI